MGSVKSGAEGAPAAETGSQSANASGIQSRHLPTRTLSAAVEWRWPLAESKPEVPEGVHQGAFGAQRKYDVHTGVDLYCRLGEPVLAVEDGVVVAVVDFTGIDAESPWWHDTAAVLVKGASGVVCYGEVEIGKTARVGDRLRRGDRVGQVARVLVHDKGLPMDMLHLELYAPDVVEPVWWRLTMPRPQGLLDPTEFLKKAVRE